MHENSFTPSAHAMVSFILTWRRCTFIDICEIVRNIVRVQWRIQYFPEEGHNFHRGGVHQPIILQHFCQKLHKQVCIPVGCSPSMHCAGTGGLIPWGSAPEGVSAPGGMSDPWGESAILACTEADPPPPSVNRMTDRQV